MYFLAPKGTTHWENAAYKQDLPLPMNQRTAPQPNRTSKNRFVHIFLSNHQLSSRQLVHRHKHPSQKLIDYPLSDIGLDHRPIPPQMRPLTPAHPICSKSSPLNKDILKRRILHEFNKHTSPIIGNFQVCAKSL